MASSQLVATPQRNFGANEKALKIRMKSVNSIRKITKAMKMVAASKMRGDLMRLDAGKEFGINAVDMMFKSDPFMQRKTGEASHEAAELLVPISSDKGLCGSINSGIIREVKAYVGERNRSRLQIFAIGDKAVVGLTRPMPDLLKVGISAI